MNTKPNHMQRITISFLTKKTICIKLKWIIITWLLFVCVDDIV